MPSMSAPPAASAPQAAGGPSATPAPTGGQEVLDGQRALLLAKALAVLTREPSTARRPLSDLPWLLFTPVALGQCAVAEASAQQGTPKRPVGTVVWALVSPAVDARLSDLTQPVKLAPNEWRSGDIPWIIEAVGDRRIIVALIKDVADKALKGRGFKVRVASEGKPPSVQVFPSTEAPS
jgi:cytolysin-activating lysine-acyltransferase